MLTTGYNAGLLLTNYTYRTDTR